VFRKYYKGCFIAYICLCVACSSTENSFRNPSSEEIIRSNTRAIVKESTTQISTIPSQTPTIIPQTASSLEESTSLSPLVVDEEIVVETTPITAESDNGETAETEDLNPINETIPIKETIRTPTKNEPLSVVSIGDSVSYDAEPGIRAALESTGVVLVETRSYGGIGISIEGFDRYLEEALTSGPEVVTVMLGGFDLKFASKNEDIYQRMLSEAVNRILEDAKHIIWIGMPPTPAEEGLDEKRLLLNSITKIFSESKPEVHYLDTDLVLGGDQGKFQRFQKSVEGEISQIRKVRDGKDDGHLCSAGAALIGDLVYKKFLDLFSFLDDSIDWWLGEWTDDQRYDDPPGGCSYNPVK